MKKQKEDLEKMVEPYRTIILLAHGFLGEEYNNAQIGKMMKPPVTRETIRIKKDKAVIMLREKLWRKYFE